MKPLTAPQITRDNRYYTASWDVGETTDGEIVQAVISVSHYGKAEYVGQPAKCLSAFLFRRHHNPERHFYRTAFEIGGGSHLDLGTVPTERYSASQHRMRLNSLIASVTERYEQGDPAVVRFFEVDA